MGSPYISIANDHNEDHIMGERDSHIDQVTSLSPEGELLTHGHGERERERERVVDGEVQPGGDEGDNDGDNHGGDHDPWGKRPLAPSSSLEMVLVFRWISPSRRLPKGRKFRGAL